MAFRTTSLICYINHCNAGLKKGAYFNEEEGDGKFLGKLVIDTFAMHTVTEQRISNVTHTHSQRLDIFLGDLQYSSNSLIDLTVICDQQKYLAPDILIEIHNI